jgi:hypothetical protein
MPFILDHKRLSGAVPQDLCSPHPLMLMGNICINHECQWGVTTLSCSWYILTDWSELKRSPSLVIMYSLVSFLEAIRWWGEKFKAMRWVFCSCVPLGKLHHLSELYSIFPPIKWSQHLRMVLPWELKPQVTRIIGMRVRARNPANVTRIPFLLSVQKFFTQMCGLLVGGGLWSP